MAPALPTGERGRILALGLLVLAIVVLWIGLVSPLLGWYGARAQRLADARSRYARETALIATLPQLRAAAAQAARTPTRSLLEGDSDATAGAALQEQVQGMATTAGVSLTSIETLPAEQLGQYRRIGVRVEANAPLPVVVKLLNLVETAEPRMKVDDMRLTATPVLAKNASLPLDSAFTVYGFRVGTAADSSSK